MPRERSKTAVIYARFSPRKNAADCKSCDTQIEYCTKYCKLHEMKIVGVFQDDALSGKSTDNRPGFQKALNMTVKLKSNLVVYSLSRMARSVINAAEITVRLRKAKAKLVSVTEGFDMNTTMGNAMFQFLAIMAEIERQQVSERTSDAMLYHQSKGRRMCSSSRLPYGWKNDPDDPARMLPHGYEIEVIKVIEELNKEGFSLRETCVELALRGYEPRMTTRIFKGDRVSVKGVWQYGLVRTVLERAKLDFM